MDARAVPARYPLRMGAALLAQPVVRRGPLIKLVILAGVLAAAAASARRDRPDPTRVAAPAPRCAAIATPHRPAPAPANERCQVALDAWATARRQAIAAPTGAPVDDAHVRARDLVLEVCESPHAR